MARPLFQAGAPLPTERETGGGLERIQEAWDGPLEYVRGMRPAFPPGSKQQYSNDGYFLLCAIVAAVSEYDTYHEYLREELFGPAGMVDTDVYPTEERLTNPRIAHSYAIESGEHVDVTERIPLWQAAGDPYSTVPDLIAFGRAMGDDTLLKRAYRHIALSPKMPGVRSRFGTYAPVAHLRDNQWVLGAHGGGVGISANVDWFPDTDWVVAVLCNHTSEGEGATESIAELARELITGRPGDR